MYTVATKISQVGKVHKPQLNLTAQEFTKTVSSKLQACRTRSPIFSRNNFLKITCINMNLNFWGV